MKNGFRDTSLVYSKGRPLVSSPGHVQVTHSRLWLCYRDDLRQTEASWSVQPLVLKNSWILTWKTRDNYAVGIAALGPTGAVIFSGLEFPSRSSTKFNGRTTLQVDYGSSFAVSNNDLDQSAPSNGPNQSSSISTGASDATQFVIFTTLTTPSTSNTKTPNAANNTSASVATNAPQVR